MSLKKDLLGLSDRTWAMAEHQTTGKGWNILNHLMITYFPGYKIKILNANIKNGSYGWEPENYRTVQDDSRAIFQVYFMLYQSK